MQTNKTSDEFDGAKRRLARLIENSASIDHGRIYTTKELAALLRVHPRTLERRRAAGLLPQYIAPGGVIRYPAAYVWAWVRLELIGPTGSSARRTSES